MLTAEFGGIDGLAIDFDGVLANSVNNHNLARQEAFDQMAMETGDSRLSHIDPKIHKAAHRHGANTRAIIGWALHEAGIVQSTDDELVTRTAEFKNDIHARLVASGEQEVPGASHFLQAMLGALDGNVTIVTTSSRETDVRPFLRRYKLDESFPDRHIISLEDLGPDHMKPDRFGYLLALGTFSHDLMHRPGRMLAVEDTPQGIMAANGVGATVVGLATTFTPLRLAKFKGEQHPAYVARDMWHLAEMCGLQLPAASRRPSLSRTRKRQARG